MFFVRRRVLFLLFVVRFVQLLLLADAYPINPMFPKGYQCAQKVIRRMSPLMGFGVVMQVLHKYTLQRCKGAHPGT